MSRYIDIEPYEKDGWYLQKRYHNKYCEVVKTTPLGSVPTAEVEPVVYCKDCKYWRYDDCQNDSHEYCPISENDYCSKGEKKDEND